METLSLALDYLLQYSYLGVVVLILMFSFVLPLSKTLVIVASGVLTAKGFGNIYIYFYIAILTMLFADSIYYSAGRLLGRRVLQWSVFAHRTQAIENASERFRQHAWFTVLVSRFLPYLRVFIYIVAGIQRMPYWSFISANGISSAFYTAASVWLGYLLAENQELLVERVKDAESYAVVIVLLSVIAYVYHRRHKAK